ncbi:MAG: RluA family pseudouridine synthase [Bacillota bacterium]|nr:RluA family pseudouridine synthase [Bacillota bacterium]
MNEYNFTVTAEDESLRIDKFLSKQLTEVSRSAIQHWIDAENVLVNNKCISKNYKVSIGEKIVCKVPDPEPYSAVAEDIPLDIVYEDNDLLVVNKPKGMVVHPAAGNYTGTLVNALLFHCKDSLSGINGVLRPGIVHRIDKDTSGLLIVAKNDFSHKFLAKQIKEHSFTREYEAVVIGNIKKDNGVINAPIGRHPIERKKMAVTEKASRDAETSYEVIERFSGYTHVKLKLKTGRTHQIRVHMAYIGHPVAGDKVYGPQKQANNLNGQCLHARKIGFIHPINGEYMEFSSDLPDYFKNFINKIKKL